MDKTRLKKPAPMSIPIHQDLRAVLLSVPVEERKGFVVPECAAAYDNGTLTYKLKNILEACGIKTSKKDENGKTICLKSFHSTRSFAATEMANAGIPLTDICSMLNHSSVETTEGYLRKDRSRLSHCVEVLPSMFGENVAPKVSLSIDEDVADLLKSKLLQGESISEGIRRLIGSADMMNVESRRTVENSVAESVAVESNRSECPIAESASVETPTVEYIIADTRPLESLSTVSRPVEYPIAPVSLTENPLKVVA